ncbi:hypothetical protein BH24GEM3_BH24GEM3_09190 [soil metagenome]|jgi:virulence-associated protein VagC|nr:hypothetical protein [Gemmatimonadota bacterium]MBA4158161.1 hypothetical protein [Gemmatimonadota bacterium]
MRAKVTEQGVVIPKRMLPDVEEVEIRAENGTVLVRPVQTEDPILDLGSAPVECGAPDASERHDEYLYGGVDE